MRVDMNTIVRKMVLLGVPFLPLGCESSCPDGSQSSPVRTQLIVQNPNLAAGDGGMASAALVEAFRKCLEEDQCLDLCRMENYRVQSCMVIADDAGVGEKRQIVLSATLPPTLCEGRRPDCDRRGPAPVPPIATTPVGDWLARAAYLERRSVPAFARLADELAAHDAPDTLVTSARRAASEEGRHERIMTTLARRFGARPARSPRPARRNVRALDAVAGENAEEGCVRETLGALIACWQARWAGDRRIRGAMKIIARDEAGHAELAWQVHGWAQTRLGPAARRRLGRRLRDEAQCLRAEIARAGDPDRSLIETAGFPPAATSRRIAAGAAVLIWSRARG